MAPKDTKRETLGMRAALTAEAARPTPSSTSAQEPVSKAAAAVRVTVPSTMPNAAMAIRRAFPYGREAQASIVGVDVAITCVMSAAALEPLRGRATYMKDRERIAPGLQFLTRSFA
jgi:hypothetical protein